MNASFLKLVGAALWTGALAVAVPAHAQATRTWISGVGDDLNPCSRTAPCATFAAAQAVTADGGEIDALDPADYGDVTITKSLTLASDGVGTAGILAVGINGITVNAPANATVYLRGLTIDGGPSGSNSPYGVQVASGDVHIDNCVIRGFTGSPGAGIGVTATTNASRVFITRTKLYGNRTGVLSLASVASPVAIVDTVLDRNADFGIRGVGVPAVFSLTRAVVTGSTTGISAPAPAKVVSYGDNLISGLEAGTVLTPAALR